MLIFCPNCGTRLTLAECGNSYRFSCETCAFIHRVKSSVISRKYPKLKEVDEVLNDARVWDNVDSTNERCPKCDHNRAYFFQMQTRSADEPMTTFYRCCQCTHQWKE